MHSNPLIPKLIQIQKSGKSLVASSHTCPLTPNTRWPPKPPSWCTRFKGGYPGLRPSPRVSLLDCKDDDVEERVALQAGLDGDQPAADCTPSCHCIAGHYQGDATSLGEETPPRTDSSNADDVCCRLLPASSPPRAPPSQVVLVDLLPSQGVWWVLLPS